jgi:3-methyladenine DNA glycosylase AlkD
MNAACSATPQDAAQAAMQSIRALPVTNTPALRKIRRQWSATLKSQAPAYVLRFTEHLLNHASWSARLVGYEVIAGHPATFGTLTHLKIERMARGLADWGSIDLFGVTVSGPAWRAGRLSTLKVRAWARSRDRWRRRLALVSTVALNVPSRGGHGDTGRTLDICARLLDDREPMVIKALSWALRALAKRDPYAVKTFLIRHRELLPARVLREVRNVLDSGVKRPSR